MMIKKNLIDLYRDEIYPVEIIIDGDKIKSVNRINENVEGYVLPGFIDAHVHVESSMLIPSEFARHAVKHGTVSTISDPHEIANVMGIAGVDYMIENGKKVPFNFFFGAPSCVPATTFETAGAVIDSNQIKDLINRKEIVYLAEMMNFPGVLFEDAEVMRKLYHAKQAGKPIDGHAPGLRGEQMRAYFSAGITTDHECFKYEEAKEKAEFGVKILIREGSAAKNFDELIPLIEEFPKLIMFCSDDKHPDNLMEGHINQLVKRALQKGYNLFNVLRAASLNVIEHYNLPVGTLRTGDYADFICIDNLDTFNIKQTYVKGNCVAENGVSFIKPVSADIINNFNCSTKKADDFKISYHQANKIRVIEALDGQLITNELIENPLVKEECIQSNPANDVLKISVVNRYSDAPVASAFIKNVGLKNGAIASCVAHDCHNIVVVGTNDEDMAAAVNAIINNKGGISLANGDEILDLALPVAGIMTNESGEQVAEKYIKLDRRAKELGSNLKAPYMTLSFMALLVIPNLKLSDLGLFSGEKFEFVTLEVD